MFIPSMLEAYKMQEGGGFSAYNNGHTKDVCAKQNVFICVLNSARSSAPKNLINEPKHFSPPKTDAGVFNDHLKFQHTKISGH